MDILLVRGSEKIDTVLICAGTKYLKLTNTIAVVESEIFKFRAQAGEYSTTGSSSGGSGGGGSSGGSGRSVGGGEGDKEGEKKGKEAKKSGGKTSDVASLPRKMFAEKLDEIWSDLGSSEIRQGMLVKPSDYHLVAIGGMVKTQEVICTHCCPSALSSMQPEGWQVGCRLPAADFGQGLTWRMWTAPSPV
jgi:hypothetical protein